MKLKLFILSAIVIASTFLFTNCKKKDKEPEPEPTPTPATPSPLAVVSTSTISTITATSAICGGNITSEGTSAITAVGVCWDTNTSPTTLKPHTNNGAGTGIYTSTLSGLLPNTTYYVRAYATNGSGTAYGNEVSFTTNPAWVTVSSTNGQITGFAIIGSKLFAGSGSNVKVSTNNGATWTNTSNSFGDNVNTIFVNGSNLFAGMMGNNGTGIYKSPDEGVTWTSVNNTAINLSSFTSAGSDIFAGGVFSGIYKSTDNGDTWALVISGLTNTNVIAMCSSGTSIFAGTNNTGGTVCCFKSTDNGASWSASNTGLPMPANANCFVTINTNLFIVANQKIYLSTNDGNNWVSVNNGLPSTVTKIISYGNKIFAATYSGIFVSLDNGANWNSMNIGLTNLFIYDMIIKTSILIATSSNGEIYNYPL